MTAKRLRVLFLLPSMSGGGAERCALNLLRLLDRSRHEPVLGLLRAEGSLLSDVPQDVPVVAFKPRFRHLLRWAPVPAGKGTLAAASQIRQMVEHVGPDVLLSFMPETSLPTSLAGLFRSRRSFTWIAAEHNATRTRLKGVIRNPVKRFVLSRWIRSAYAASDHVVAVADGVKRGLVEDFGLAPAHVTVIYNPIDVARIQEAARAPVSFPRTDTRTIVAVGSLTRQKGFDILIWAFAQVRRRLQAQLLILGRGELKEELEAQARGLGVADHVTLAGFVPNPWAYMARSDVFVLSSRWEGFPNVPLEAMACGVPVVAADCDHGPREIITHGRDGILVPVGEVDAFAEAVCRVLEDKALADGLREGGYRRVMDFDGPKVCAQYEDLFQRIAGAVTEPSAV